MRTGLRMTLRQGDSIVITCEDMQVDGTVVIASENNVSLMIRFEAILGGHVGMMPVLLHGDGVYRSIIDGTEVSIEQRRLNS